ncbi:MAG: FtsX-like permease family protein [Desulfovibrio sp.]|jgi:putative ABC transport system permease protein|nr:FtsX-like permease family protein [Desulfovibrio sp.]
MTLFTISLRYTRAKWARTFLLAAVFTLGLASMTGLHQVSALIAESFEKKLVSYGANILITPRQETLKISYGGYFLGDVALREQSIGLAAALRAVDSIPLRANVAVVAPKMIAVAVLPEAENRAVALVGVSWESELALKAYWEAEGDFPRASEDSEVLAGGVAARKLNLAPGTILRLRGRDMRVSGVLRLTGTDDDNVLFVPLPLAQTLAGKPGQAAFLEVAALCSGCPIDDIVAQLQGALPDTEVRALAQVAESRMYTVRFAQNLAFYVSLVILVTACAMLVMSMLSAVTERRREIGIMRAVGFSRFKVFAVFVSEAVSIGTFAGLTGYLLGQGLSAAVLRRLDLTETAGLLLDPPSWLAVILTTALTAGLAAAFPAWRASLVEPAESLASF